MPQRSDEQLLEDYRQGDSAAFRSLIERHQDDLLRFLVRLTGDRSSAEDVFQETFLQVHLSMDSFDPTRRFKPWMFTIAANKARDLLRKRVRRQEVDLSAPVAGGSGDSGPTYVDLMEIDIPPPDRRLESADQDRLVQQAVDRMPLSLREILLLAYFQRLSYAQIADELEIPLGTVKSRLHAAVASFAKHWRAVSTPNSPT
ncbi:MAG: sigma-70 family RNA polymerase sigma factor [Phycisphaerae bacterium]|nr:sigma-70 family RNA polymerase sigma factor [Phycisphaerae bacterium]